MGAANRYGLKITEYKAIVSPERSLILFKPKRSHKKSRRDNSSETRQQCETPNESENKQDKTEGQWEQREQENIGNAARHEDMKKKFENWAKNEKSRDRPESFPAEKWLENYQNGMKRSGKWAYLTSATY